MSVASAASSPCPMLVEPDACSSTLLEDMIAGSGSDPTGASTAGAACIVTGSAVPGSLIVGCEPGVFIRCSLTESASEAGASEEMAAASGAAACLFPPPCAEAACSRAGRLPVLRGVWFLLGCMLLDSTATGASDAEWSAPAGSFRAAAVGFAASGRSSATGTRASDSGEASLTCAVSVRCGAWSAGQSSQTAMPTAAMPPQNHAPPIRRDRLPRRACCASSHASSWKGKARSSSFCRASSSNCSFRFMAVRS